MEDKLYKSYLKCIIKEDEDDGEETLDPTPDQFMIDDAEGVGYYDIHFCIPESFIYSTLDRIDEYHDAMSVHPFYYSCKDFVCRTGQKRITVTLKTGFNNYGITVKFI